LLATVSLLALALAQIKETSLRGCEAGRRGGLGPMKRRKLKPWMRHEWLFIWTATFVTFLIGAAAITYRASNSSTSKVIRPHDPFGSSDLSSTRLAAGYSLSCIIFSLRASGFTRGGSGPLAGLVHGVFLLVTALPLLPFVHPRMASEYHGATTIRQLEPPGFLAMNYGYGTPLSTLLGQILYGATLGGFLQLQQSMSG
jgi:hypothetical protein